MTPKKIAVIHQQPLELFPPAVNFLDFLDQSRPARELVLVLTTGTELNDQLYSNKHATIKRLYTNRRNVGFLARLAKFSSFITKAFLDLIKFKPDVIVYFETFADMLYDNLQEEVIIDLEQISKQIRNNPNSRQRLALV